MTTVAESRENMTVRQRGRADRSGADARAVMYGGNSSEPYVEPVKRQAKNPVKDNYRNPSEFYAGPSEPGKLRNPRRNNSAYEDHVGFLLTDEGLMSTANTRRSGPPRPAPGSAAAARRGPGGAPSAYEQPAGARSGQPRPKVAAADRVHVDNACFPTQPEAKWRSGVRITHPSAPMDAPYFEDQDPQPPREQPRVTGKRHCAPAERKETLFIDPSRPLPKEEYETRPCNPKSNKANESVNVLCLKDYTAEELNEPRPTYRPRGPREWDAPDMPPAPRPRIAPINTSAKAEHDVLGTGRWGTPEKERPRGVARGSCRPGRDTANLFAGNQQQRARRSWVPPDTIPKQTALQKKYGGQPDLLRYYDPNVDTAPEQPKPRLAGNRTNVESKEEPKPYRPARAPGLYRKNGERTTEERNF